MNTSTRPGAGFTGACASAGLVFDPLHLGAVALDVLACGRAEAAAVELRQRSRLRHLLQSAARHSALYRERLGGGFDADAPLVSLPCVTKAELIERYDEWVTDPGIKLEQLREFTASPARIGEAFLGKYLVWESSGTSHLPCIFVQDARTMAVYDALEALRRSTPRPLQRLMDPMMLAERMAYVGVKDGHFASIVSATRLQRLNPLLASTLRSFSIMQPVNALIDELNRFAPTIIATYPTVATLLAEQAVSGALRFQPKEVWTGGETLSAAAKQYLERTLGTEVRNSYGASEFISIGWECTQRRMHANSDWVVLEPVDEHNRAVAPGVASCSTLLTNLVNHVQPIIRYDLGDQITVHAQRCSCGSPMPVIEVQGRRDDTLVMDGHDGRQVAVLPMALSTAVEEEAGIFDFQLRQRDSHTLELWLGPGQPEPAAALQRCRLAVARFAQTYALAPVRLVAPAGEPPPRGRSGKARRIIGLPRSRC